MNLKNILFIAVLTLFVASLVQIATDNKIAQLEKTKSLLIAGDGGI